MQDSLPAATPQHVAIINFMLWQMAYTKLFFTDTLWPYFSTPVLDDALQWFAARDRRFGASSALLAC